VTIAACGTLNGPRTGTISPPTDALALWQDFPADQNPRPIVLLSSDSPGQGFDSGDAKIAWLCQKFRLSTSLPAEIPTPAVASWSDGTKATYAGLSAAVAFAALNRPGPGASNAQCQTVAPLPVIAARLGTAGFSTDRGMAQMSAWLFRATGARAEFQLPAIESSALWPGPFERSIGGGATVSPSGRQLTFSFVGGPPDGPCAEDYTGVVAESPHAVAVAVQSNPGRVQGGPVTCDAMGHLRSVTVQLASPLGGRVLVDASGGAVAVCPEAIRAGCF
jgi:hypothetical protein